MHNKRHKLHKFLAKDTSADDVIRSHAYSRVAKDRSVVPTRRTSTEATGNSGYRDSMVGSISQYREKVPPRPEVAAQQAPSSTADNEIIGNRAKSGSEHTPNRADQASLERRHHFIEPPKRGFNRFG